MSEEDYNGIMDLLTSRDYEAQYLAYSMLKGITNNVFEDSPEHCLLTEDLNGNNLKLVIDLLQSDDQAYRIIGLKLCEMCNLRWLSNRIYGKTIR